jgi:SAM-dependent methyltransferase
MKVLRDKIFNFLPSYITKIIVPSCFEINDFVARAASEIPSGSYVLDAGAGQCTYKPFFKQHAYIAVDAAWGDDDWDYSQLDIICDLEQLPFSENTFDAVICAQVLEHVKEPQRVIVETFKTLKPGGIIYLSAPQGWGIHQRPHDYFRYTNYGLQYLFEKSGFHQIDINPSCGYFGYLANRLTVFPKTLFWQIKRRWVRLIMFPLELVSIFLFVLIFPLMLNGMDSLDRRKEYTLHYLAKGVKPANGKGQPNA